MFFRAFSLPSNLKIFTVIKGGYTVTLGAHVRQNFEINYRSLLLVSGLLMLRLVVLGS